MIQNYYENGKCSRCGSCCGLIIPFTQKELSQIKKYVKEHNIKQSKRIFGNNQYMDCCFFDRENHKCNIYEVRPFVCRDFKCCRKDWMKRRDQYDRRAKYNKCPQKAKQTLIATFDDLIYDDPYFITIYLIEQIRSLPIIHTLAPTDEQYINDIIKPFLDSVGRPNLLPFMEQAYEQGMFKEKLNLNNFNKLRGM